MKGSQSFSNIPYTCLIPSSWSGFRGRGRGRGPRGGRGGRDDRGRGRGGGGFGGFGDWDNENGRGRGLLDGEGFGEWNPENNSHEEAKREGRRERKSRWGDSNEVNEENENGVREQLPTLDEQKVPVEPHHVQDPSEGLESFDAPATPPDMNEDQDHEVPNDFGLADTVEMEDVNPDVPHTDLGLQSNSHAGREDQSDPATEESKADFQNTSEAADDATR